MNNQQVHSTTKNTTKSALFLTDTRTSQQYKPTMLSLNTDRADEPWVEEKNRYVSEGKFGSLISPTGKITYSPIKHIKKAPLEYNIVAWDNHKKDYITTSKFQIPKTYTLTSKPKNKTEEYRLWRYTSTLINHELVYSNDNGSLNKETYAKATSESNRNNRGRYDAWHFSPKIKLFDEVYGKPFFPQERIKNFSFANQPHFN